MRYSRSIGHIAVLLGVLASLDYLASFCLVVDCAKVLEASDNTRTDDICVRWYCIDVYEKMHRD
jgi:hypothetical protein